MLYNTHKKELLESDIYTDEQGNTWFVSKLEKADLRALGLASVKELAKPSFDERTQFLQRTGNFNEADFEYILSFEAKDKPLEELKALKLEDLNEEYETFLAKPLHFKEKEFRVSASEFGLLSTYLNLFSLLNGVPESFAFISLDNSFVRLDLSELTKLTQLMSERLNEGALKLRECKNALSNAHSKAELETITLGANDE
ncbi:hypothetical protein DMB95_00050 [Campylobacter sp. MIT 12-8780]|uniref:hypothetical protein n=1 Tax=unclassified Campylobacter TaxID=2593542 RepID=UPI00115CF929|nr:MULTISPECIES: hypothetical protein [unclassified Campylobacter]NDJ26350.1 hypothetical protein [Campylobacter sp. MIT 19-121]TQR42927.1 hypothetical protein DMB95_00050 [Campylobacter sp. MIT 12-8780]